MMQGQQRKSRNTQPRMKSQNADSTILDYNAIGTTVVTGTGGSTTDLRPYIPGVSNGLNGSAGPSVAGYYSTGKFLPGTSAKWEPSVSFTTSGRVYVGFTDNPEVVSKFIAGAAVDRTSAIRSLSNVTSFPVWQETDIQVPSRLRRKMFDVNQTIDVSNVDALDRSMQTAMLFAVDGAAANLTVGSFWFHDKLVVEGMTNVAT